MTSPSQIKQMASSLQDRLVQIRRTLHQHPELGFEEEQTGALVADTLRGLGLEVQTGVAKTGVVGLLRGAKPGKTVALRADMDALPVTELNQHEYRSKTPGKMHACGHDAHVTTLLGTAMVLSQLRDQLAGNVKFIFQPAEEGPGGAEQMVAEGVLENPKVDAIVGAHVWPGIPAGRVGVAPGPMMAAPDTMNLKIIGRGGHGAEPHLTIDAVAISAQVITALQNIVSRMRNPMDPVVVTIGSIHGGTRFNVIAQEVEMAGTVRTFNPETRKKMPGLIEKVVAGVCSSFDAKYEFQWIPSYPATVNEPAVTEVVRQAAVSILGDDSVLTELEPSMGGEDFSYFLARVPGCFFRLGVGNDRKATFPLHHPQFDVDESALSSGVAVFAQSTLDLLAR